MPERQFWSSWYRTTKHNFGLTWAFILALHWRRNEYVGVSNHQPHGCLLNRLLTRRSKKTSKLRVTGLCAGNSPGTGEFPAQMVSYAENVSICWRHHGICCRFNTTMKLRQKGYHFADDILECTMKMFIFRLKFYSSCSEGLNWQYASIGPGNVWAPNRRKAVIRNSDDLVQCHIYASLSLKDDPLGSPSGQSRCMSRYAPETKQITNVHSLALYQKLIKQTNVRQNTIIMITITVAMVIIETKITKTMDAIDFVSFKRFHLTPRLLLTPTHRHPKMIHICPMEKM